jgi:hypothetical protein
MAVELLVMSRLWRYISELLFKSGFRRSCRLDFIVVRGESETEGDVF